MARAHLLTACAVMIGRLCGFSPGYDEMGEALMPVDKSGRVRTSQWAQYVNACRLRRPWDIREELWLAAYMTDLQGIFESSLTTRFRGEAGRHPTAIWRLLQQHMEATLNARVMDSDALLGTVAFESAMARTMALALRRLFGPGRELLAFYAREAARALLSPMREPARPLISYRRAVLELIRHTAIAWTASRVYRRGIRQRERGSQADEDGWPLVERVLGSRAAEIHPTVIRFYTNPAPFTVKVALNLETLPARLWSRLAVHLLGQGLYECSADPIDARFRVFRRGDGSMHFIRELYCGNALRVFDSDFFVREIDGEQALFERFVELHLDVRMALEPLPDGGLCIRSRRIYWHGIPMPSTGFQVEFQTHVVKSQDGTDLLVCDGFLLLEPQSRTGQFLMYKLLRRPHLLGHIRYTAVPPSDYLKQPDSQSSVLNTASLTACQSNDLTI